MVQKFATALILTVSANTGFAATVLQCDIKTVFQNVEDATSISAPVNEGQGHFRERLEFPGFEFVEASYEAESGRFTVYAPTTYARQSPYLPRKDSFIPVPSAGQRSETVSVGYRDVITYPCDGGYSQCEPVVYSGNVDCYLHSEK